MNDRDAMQKALEALEWHEEQDEEIRYNECPSRAAIEALRQALVQPEQDHGFDRTASHMAGEYVDTAQHEQSSAMDEWRSMVVVNLLRRCPNLSKHELCELAAHFESRLPVAQPEQEPVAQIYVKNGYWIETRNAETKGLSNGLHNIYTAPVSKPCEITDLLQQKFQSGNNVPVERVTITRSEYETALRSKNT